MSRVTTRDGSRIAFERERGGPAVILVAYDAALYGPPPLDRLATLAGQSHLVDPKTMAAELRRFFA
jgi:hypothetical protein